MPLTLQYVGAAPLALTTTVVSVAPPMVFPDRLAQAICAVTTGGPSRRMPTSAAKQLWLRALPRASPWVESCQQSCDVLFATIFDSIVSLAMGWIHQSQRSMQIRKQFSAFEHLA